MFSRFRDTTNVYICLIRCDITDRLELSVYNDKLVKLAVIRTEGLAIRRAIKGLPEKTEYFFDKFLAKELK